MKHNIFVYGTLKRGFSNHYYLKGSEFLGVDLTSRRFCMCVFEGIPYVFDCEAGQFSGFLKGEVYRVDGFTLEMLDKLEEYPGEYVRKLVNLQRFGFAWFYLYPHYSLSFYEGKIVKPTGGVIEFKV